MADISVSVSQPSVSVSIQRGDTVISSLFVEHETPTPATDGSTVLFTTEYNYTAGTLRVYQDKLMQKKDTDYEETSSNSFTMTIAPDSDEDLWVGYIKG